MGGRMRIGVGGVAVMLLAFLAIAAPARAAVETTTETVIRGTASFPAMNPCTGATSTVTISFNGVIHMTMFETGEMHITVTQAGSFSIVPDDPASPTYAGHFAMWFGANMNRDQEGFWATFNIKGTGSDGSSLKFQAVQQFHVSATGVTVEFVKVNCL